ncbi:DUF4113 domain-containing protein, partial [Salmonella enterica subsp. enterica serovar Lubbock]|nr:DUF4113 domain-containing protein [Salmonella enterica subsp. enterica serovar Lubbock]
LAAQATREARLAVADDVIDNNGAPDAIASDVARLHASYLKLAKKGKVWFAGRGTAPEWQMKREMLSPSYTTQWTEIPIASF